VFEAVAAIRILYAQIKSTAVLIMHLALC